MVEKSLICAVITVWGAIACTTPTTSSTKIIKSSVVPSTCISSEKAMISDETIIQETTQRELSKNLVGVSNIWERELPDDKGVIAPRMAADITIFNLASKQSRQEEVFAGSVISLGSDRYCVVNVEYSDSSYGSVTLRKIP